jgi:hypothetical protein
MLKAEGGGLQMSLHGFSGGADVDPSSRRGSEGEKKGPGGVFANFREFFGRRVLTADDGDRNFQHPTSNPAIESRIPRFIPSCER